jgi:outer membrane biosynthesis protein TonB
VPALLVVVCCTVVVVMAGAFVGLRVIAPRAASAAQPTARQAQHEDGIFSKVSKAARSFFNASSAPASVQRDAADRRTPEKRNTPRRVVTGRVAARAGVNETRSIVPVQAPAPRVVEWPRVPSWNVAVEEVAVPLERAPLTAEERATVYDTRNDDVVPALLVKPKLASIDQPDALARARSILEAVIAEDGHVMQVRLVRTTPERRYYDAMLLPAVKAWVFEPAIRGGQPVRYRLRIPLT